ncbi:hypothetical protein CC86DRAFT_334249 [Ophiobolus disseminans]|uniref:Phosphoribosylaminoimidazole-succinocarboxamide synthase n=1 Tax=Ophiobolus disseminans TaxID=1469910 RepID=A0A6A6ZG59_9PLEO|nr:hypothetical protein CC86DRAFT_334249 [Ophiobolus disseminans]
MSLEAEYQLKHTNVSRPQLSHQGSLQSVAASIAASEGYYSLADNSSSEGDQASRPLFRTPPSHHRTPAQSHEQLLQDTEPITSLKGVGIPRQHPQQAHQSPAVSTIAEERPGSQETYHPMSRDMDAQQNGATSGAGSTAYIRFAIDQLTRDEEVRGSRVYPLEGPVEDESEDDYPVDRIVSDDGLGYMAQDQATQQRMSRHIAPKPARIPSSRRTTDRSMPIAAQPHPSHATHSQKRSQQTHTQYLEQPYQPTPATHPQQPSSPRASRDVFVASSAPHAPLRFLPAILRPVWLGLYIFLCLLMLAGLIACAVLSNRSGGMGLWDYGSFGDGRYFVFEYLPTLLGMILFIWLIQIQTALQRVVPFISMASESFHRRSEAVFLRLFPTQFLLPNTQHFRAGHRRVGACYIIFWLFSWTIPLLASSFNVRYDIDRSVWRWVAVQGVIWTIVVLYVLLIIALLMLMFFLIRNSSGLKWDPRSLADVIALLERSNNLANYNGSETFEKDDWHLVANRADRIGYWSTTKRPNDIFYGIGEEGGEIRRFSIEQGRIREKGPEREYPDTTPGEQNDFSIRMDIRSPGVRLRYLPWYLRDTSVIAWIVIAFVLIIALLVVSFINSNVRVGFLPQVFARTNAGGFSASNFLYSFVPALIGQFLFLALLSLDYSIRVLQPYMALAAKGGSTAETSLLVDYACRLPISVTINAIENKHFQTAILSLVSLASMSIPVIAGGCFWTQYYDNESVVRVAADLPGYYALCFFLALYAVALLALIPGRRRAALPHRSNSIAEIISWVYQSPILSDRAFARPQTKPDLVARLMGNAYMERTWTRSLVSLVRPSRDNLRPDSPTDPALNEKSRSRKDRRDAAATDPGRIRYGFGIHVGRDGLEHLGIDRVRRGDRSGRELVIWEEQQKNKRKSWNEAV